MYNSFIKKFAAPLLVIVFSCTIAIAQQKAEVPPKEYIKTLSGEAAAAVRVHVEKITLDSCKNCTSTGKLYVINASVKKVYFDKSKKIKGTAIIYTSSADKALYSSSGDYIVFLSKVPARNLEAFKSVIWEARQATEFQYDKKTESFISSNQKK